MATALEPWTFEVAFNKLMSIAPGCTLAEAKGYIETLMRASRSSEFNGPVPDVVPTVFAPHRLASTQECYCDDCMPVYSRPAVLDHIETHKIQAIKELRATAGLGLKEAKEAVEAAVDHNPRLRDACNAATRGVTHTAWGAPL